VVRGGAKSDPVVRTHDDIPWAKAFGEAGAELDTLGIKAAGFGGQGILALGEILAKAGLREGMHATWLPAYGPEMRGGTANCSVVISTDEIGNPMVVAPHVLIAMNRPSMEKFEEEVAPGGVLLYDSSLIEVEPTRKDIQSIGVPATKIADSLGSGRSANVVMIGAVMGMLGFPGNEAAGGIVGKLGRTDEIRATNLKALQGGIEAVQLSKA